MKGGLRLECPMLVGLPRMRHGGCAELGSQKQSLRQGFGWSDLWGWRWQMGTKRSSRGRIQGGGSAGVTCSRPVEGSGDGKPHHRAGSAWRRGRGLSGSSQPQWSELPLPQGRWGVKELLCGHWHFCSEGGAVNPKEPALIGQGISAGQQGHPGTACTPMGTLRPGDFVPAGPPWSGGCGNSQPEDTCR